MNRRRYTEEQIIGVLKEAEAEAKPLDLCRKHGISEGTLYRWKSKYSGLTVSELKRLKGLEEENRRLKQIVADQALKAVLEAVPKPNRDSTGFSSVRPELVEGRGGTILAVRGSTGSPRTAWTPRTVGVPEFLAISP